MGSFSEVSIRFAKIILSAGLGTLALGLLTLPATAAQPAVLPAHLPLYFEAGQGQAHTPSQFIARGHDYQFLIAPAEAQIALRKTAGEPEIVRMQFVGANAQAQIHGDAELSGKINYLTGNDPAQWRTGVAMFAKVRVEELYPGVNLVYYGNQRQLEYDFAIAPGANPDVIEIHFEGADKISVNPQGELILKLAGGEICQPKPVICQMMDGVRKEIEGGYRMVDAHTVAFAIGQYDRRQPLVIDPLLSYSTYFGGTAGDTAWAVALDTNGFVYITGETFSSKSFTNGWRLGPAFSTYGAFQTNYNGGKYAGDAFVIKFSTASNHVFYLTYLGGNGDDAAYSIAVDNAGNAYVAGYTDSINFPTKNPIPGHTNISGVFDSHVKLYPSDAFVAELDASGSNLVYSTYLGGDGADAAYSVAVDSFGHAFVTGFTYSTNFPTTTNTAMFNQLQCTNSFYFNANAFVTEVASNGGALVYSTYFGGTNYDIGKGIAVDSSNFVYVTGFTASTNFPTINALVQQQLVWTNVVGTNQIPITNSLNGSLLNGSAYTNKTSKFSTPFAYDAFVAKFDSSSGTNLTWIYSTLLGGTNNDVANGIAVDNNGAAYVTGWTVSRSFPNTSDTNIAGELHSFVATNTTSFLATNVFLTKIVTVITNGTTNAVIAWSAVFGGKGVDVGNAVALDPAGDVFVTGSASSTNFPIYNVPGLMSRTNSGKSDAFVIAFNTNATALLYSTYLGGKDNDFGYGIAVDTDGNAYVVGQTLSTNFQTTVNALIPFRNGTNDAFLTKIMLTVPPPTITVQPISQTVGVGSIVTFNIDGTAYAPYFFQWQDGTNLVVTNLVVGTNSVNVTNLVDARNISGATNYTLTITNAQMTNSGFYYQIIVTNYGGAVTSTPPANLTVTNVPPAITVQPISQTNGVGTTVTLTVTANGTAPLRYQWQVNGTNLVDGGQGHNNGQTIRGATNKLLTISNVQLTNSGIYTVIVTNIAGSVTSSNAILTVLSSPEIFVQPTNQAIAVSSNATFVVTAIGTVPLHYQWQKDGTNLVNEGHGGHAGQISGATTNVLTISNAQINNHGSYSVIVTNIAGSVTSFVAVLTVTNIPPAITVQPASKTVSVGSNVTFTVIATGTAPLSYQWQTNGINLVNGGRISGVTTNVLTISSAQTNDNADYRVIVSNITGLSVTSSNAQLTVALAPVITMQPTPTNQSMAVGAKATFTVTAVGKAPLSYQWQVNGTNLATGGGISNVTTNVLTINNAQTNNSGSYAVIVANSAGSVTSSNAQLTVTNVPPAITRQPTNQAVVAGTDVTLVVTATGTAPLSYQWQVNGTNLVDGGRTGGHGSRNKGSTISGTTTSMLTIRNAQTNDSGNYTVIVTNITGLSVTSSVATLTVATLPVILTQPTNRAVGVGATATFAVAAVGITPLHYQWQLDGTNLINGMNADGSQISGATTTSLAISNAQTNNNGGYTVIVTNSVGSVTSSVATLTVTNIPPAITVQPADQTLRAGSNATFTVTATGTAPLSYQWQVNGTNLVDGTNADESQISGATTTNLTVSYAQTNEDGNYTVIVTNITGLSVTSSVASLTVAVLAITNQPTDQMVGVGSTATFEVYGIGTEPLFFQWQKDGTNLVDGGRISGTANNVLTITNAQTNDIGNYLLIITNLAGSVTSSVVTLTVTNIPPAITVQPANQTVGVGTTVTLAVTATGTAPLIYQWWMNETNLIDGATTNTLIISNAQTNNSGSYSVTVTNLAGSVTSSNALLTVTELPVILVQPTNQAIAVGSNATFTVTAVGIMPLSYQWWLDETNLIDGATTNTLTISNAQTTNNGSYSVTVTNLAGSVTSSNAVLTVTNIPPAITLQPTNQAVVAGTTVTLSVTATGTAPLIYQWWMNETNLIDGATTNTLIINNAQTNNSGSYTVIVTNFGGSVTSSAAFLTVASSPIILVQPTNQAIAVGSNATFAVTAIGIPPLSYQWQMDGTNLVDRTNLDGDITSGATTNVLTISNAQTNNSATNYTVIVINSAGSVTSSNAVLTVTNVPPAITVQPTNQTVSVGSNVTFAVTATGTEPLSYQWQVNLTNLVDGGNISGATSNVLTISNVQTNDSGSSYTVVVTNVAGSVTSSVAILTVTTNISPGFVMQPANQTVAPLSFANIAPAPGSGGGFILSGAGGVSKGAYYVLTSSNLLLPQANWTCIATNQFDNNGDFIFTNAAQTNAPQLFYLLKLP